MISNEWQGEDGGRPSRGDPSRPPTYNSTYNKHHLSILSLHKIFKQL